MSPTEATQEIALTDTRARERFKEKLYVILQVFGWTLFFGVELCFGLVFSPKADAGKLVFANFQITTSGILLTHLVRGFVRRRGWKTLSLWPLIPRCVALSFVASVVWILPFWWYQRVVCGWPLPKGVNTSAIFGVTLLNTAMLIMGWLCLYFFYHMFDRLRRGEVDRLQLIASAKNAELRALKSQLNPHFIFNSLNSLRALIDENPARARTTVTQLANLLRYSLQSAQHETVDFEEELKVATDYLALEQVRHEERLHVRLDIAEETLQWPIPPLLLQTVVENAVKYGISTRQAGGEITIVARVENGALVLRVSNPGEIQNKETRSNSTGVGLANARERLRLIFGEKSSLSLQADGPDQVLATAIIPLQLSKAETP
ncbi:MAG TPA: histidine kinase [Opitutaceae bacterium]|nr:histidine kinase [Opitutaceae bacterium]